MTTESLSLSHIALPAANPERLIAWYAENLGFKAHGHHLWSGGTVLAIIKGKALPNDDWHFGFRLTSEEALLHWQEQLRARGIDAGDLRGNERYKSFYIQDPEGNDIEFFSEEAPD